MTILKCFEKLKNKVNEKLGFSPSLFFDMYVWLVAKHWQVLKLDFSILITNTGHEIQNRKHPQDNTFLQTTHENNQYKIFLFSGARSTLFKDQKLRRQKKK